MQLFHMQWISYRIRFLKSRIGILLPPLVNIIPANGRLAFVRNKQPLRSGGVHGQLQTLRVRGSFLYAHCWSRRTLSTYAQTYSMASRTYGRPYAHAHALMRKVTSHGTLSTHGRRNYILPLHEHLH